PVSDSGIGIVMLRIAAVDPEKSSGGKLVGLTTIFQYPLTCQRQLHKVRIQIFSDGIVIYTRNKMSSLLQIQQIVLCKRTGRDDLPAGFRCHVNIIVQDLHTASLRETARY